MADWISFWDTPHSIYVNARHRDVHYRGIAEDLSRYVPAPDAVVMDYGCGEALYAGIVATAAGRLILVEAPPGVVAGLIARFAAQPKIEVVTPERLPEYPGQSIDLIVLHSVAQYLSTESFDTLLEQFHRLLRQNGLLIVGDVIPPEVSPLADAMTLLRFAWRRGFLGAALVGLIRTIASDYARLRAKLGITQYNPPGLLARLAAAGFSGERAPRNIGHDQNRMTFLARPA
jgi:SAM-dependent methyltransferase